MAHFYPVSPTPWPPPLISMPVLSPTVGWSPVQSSSCDSTNSDPLLIWSPPSIIHSLQNRDVFCLCIFLFPHPQIVRSSQVAAVFISFDLAKRWTYGHGAGGGGWREAGGEASISPCPGGVGRMGGYVRESLQGPEFKYKALMILKFSLTLIPIQFVGVLHRLP